MKIDNHTLSLSMEFEKNNILINGWETEKAKHKHDHKHARRRARRKKKGAASSSASVSAAAAAAAEDADNEESGFEEEEDPAAAAALTAVTATAASHDGDRGEESDDEGKDAHLPGPLTFSAFLLRLEMHFCAKWLCTKCIFTNCWQKIRSTRRKQHQSIFVYSVIWTKSYS